MKPYKFRDVSDFRKQEDYVKNTFLETVFLDEDLLQHAINFYNGYMGYKEYKVDREEALILASVGTRINSELFRLLHPRDEGQLNAFYAITPFHFFNNIIRFMDGMHHTMALDFLESKGPYLDYGGGTGGFSLFLAQKKQDVTFVESNKMCIQWMKYIKEVCGLKVDIIESGIPITKKFNMIIAKDIVEHVVDPGKFMDFLKSMLNDGGEMYTSHYPCCGPDEHAPMHFKLDVTEENGTKFFKYSVSDNLAYLRDGKYPEPSNPSKV